MEENIASLENPNNQNPEVKEKEVKYVYLDKKRRSYTGWFLVLIILLILLLPFHYIPSRGMILTKENLSFRFTIVTETDISELIERYNKASLSEKSAINSEPIVRVLMAKGILEEKKSKEDYFND